jgi:L-ribulokinase
MAKTKKYTLGIDFGTESGRAVLVDVSNGDHVAESVHKYESGVIDEFLPGTDIRLEHDTALQDPQDYITTLHRTVTDVIRRSKVKTDDIIGLGIDFTACTMLPVDANGTPLCMKKEFRANPHAWVKLWKHHAAQPEADLVNEVARRRGEEFLATYGGKISSEWFVPKALQILNDAPEIYAAADRLMEAADWVIWAITGNECRNACTAGYKAIWDKREGFPCEDYFAAVHPTLKRLVAEKLSDEYYPAGTRAGTVMPKLAKMLGLSPDTAVAVANVDAHVAVPACAVVEPGKMVMIMGTSICHMVLGTKKKNVEGQCGVVEDGIIEGFYGYEAGQSAVGDIYAWFIEHGVPETVAAEARKKKLSLHDVLQGRAQKLRPGQSGLLALDWHNGNRSVLVDAELSGLILGLHLNTRPEEIYRALIESTAYGTNKIIRSFESNGVAVKELYACGGLAERNDLVMQIFSDVTGRPIKLAASGQPGALGSAMYAAVAAGKAAGGYENIFEAARKMAHLKRKSFKPNPEANAVYAKLYSEYEILHDHFGRGGNDVMKRLRRIKREVGG